MGQQGRVLIVDGAGWCCELYENVKKAPVRDRTIDLLILQYSTVRDEPSGQARVLVLRTS